MKSKWIYILSVIFILSLSVGFTQIDSNHPSVRVHQHKEIKWQQKDLKEMKESQTHLPIIRIDTGGQKVPGSPIIENGVKVGYETTADGQTEITASFSVIDKKEGSNYLKDAPTMLSLAKISYRGNSSRFFDKKSYSIHLINEDGTENNESIIGMASHDEWVLNGVYLDRSLLRNYLAMNLAGEIMDYAPNVRYCELYVDGTYQGVYLMMETISKGKGRININKPEKNSNVTSYIVRFDREGKGDRELNNFTYYTYKAGISALDVRYPGVNQITDKRMNYINNDFSKLEKLLYSYDLNTGDYTKQIDIYEFAEYFIINELFRNIDAGRFSTFYYKEARGKLKPCVWDFNNGADNYIDRSWKEDGFSIINAPIFDALIKDKRFVSTVVAKYRQLRKGVLSEEYLLNYIDETNTWLGKAVGRNYEVWGSVFDLFNYKGMNYLMPVERNVTSHEQAVSQLREFIVIRGRWLDEHIETLYQYCHESKNAKELIR